MKRKLLYFLPVILALAAGCLKKGLVTPVAGPEGTFAGQFILLHRHVKTGVTDTLTANIQLQMSLTTGYKVTGDTATLHAGSYGTYAVNSTGNGIEFIDKTFSPTGTPTKIHLSGIYGYVYNGTILQMTGYGPLDTLAFGYDLKRK
jgi:hypothetical protein